MGLSGRDRRDIAVQSDTPAISHHRCTFLTWLSSSFSFQCATISASHPSFFLGEASQFPADQIQVAHETSRQALQIAVILLVINCINWIWGLTP
jgi:hypothetical protein